MSAPLAGGQADRVRNNIGDGSPDRRSGDVKRGARRWAPRAFPNLNRTVEKHMTKSIENPFRQIDLTSQHEAPVLAATGDPASHRAHHEDHRPRYEAIF